MTCRGMTCLEIKQQIAISMRGGTEEMVSATMTCSERYPRPCATQCNAQRLWYR